MTFPVVGAPARTLRAVLGERRTDDVCYETHHDGQDGPGPRLLSGRVRSIQAVHVARESGTFEEDRDALRPVPGSAVLTKVTRTRRFPEDIERDGQTLRWEGYLIDLDETAATAGRRYDLWSPGLRREITPGDDPEPVTCPLWPDLFTRNRPPACAKCGRPGAGTVSASFATLVPEPDNNPLRKEIEYYCQSCGHEWPVQVELRAGEFGAELRAAQDVWRTANANTEEMWFTTLELQTAAVTNEEVTYVLRDPADGARYGWRWNFAHISDGTLTSRTNLAMMPTFLADDLNLTIPTEPDEHGIRWLGVINRAAVEVARESRLRRQAKRQGYKLEKSRRLNREADDYGLYRIVDRATGNPVTSAPPHRYTMKLDEVEAWLSDHAE